MLEGLMNELIFFLHIAAVALASLWALRLGAAALIALIALESVVANIFVVKQTTLFGLFVTCSDVYIVGSLLALNLLQEFFGKESAKKAVGISFFAMAFFVVMAKLHLLYSPSGFDATHSAFTQILAHTPRIILASIVVYYITQRLDIRVFAWLRRRLGEQRLSLRVGLSLVISQSVDTLLFSFLGLYGLVANLTDIVLMSLLIKAIAISCSAPFAGFARKFARDVA